MKLATYSDGSRDGQLVVVSRDLTQAHYASDIAGRLQAALDDWNFYAPQLQDLSAQLDAGQARHAFPFEPARCLAPLPRAYQRLEGADAQDAPRMIQRTSDALGGARDSIRAAGTGALDIGAGLAVITGDVPQAATLEQGQDAIRLVMLANGLYRRAEEIGAGQSEERQDERRDERDVEIAAVFGPVAVTPDELGAAWQAARVRLILGVAVNGRKLGLIEAGEMRWSFGDLIAQAARERRLVAGTVVGSGAIRNADGARGYASLAGKRAAEQAQEGQTHTPWLRTDDRVRIEMKGADGASVFGTIEQTVEPVERSMIAIEKGA